MPAGTQPGDVLIASLGYGKSGATTQPTLTAPAGWKLVSRTTHGTVGALVVYRHTFASGETGYTWTTNVTVGGAVFLAAFGGVDTSKPIDVSAGKDVAAGGTAISTPSLTTKAASDMLVASYFGYTSIGTGTAWPPQRHGRGRRRVQLRQPLRQPRLRPPTHSRDLGAQDGDGLRRSDLRSGHAHGAETIWYRTLDQRGERRLGEHQRRDDHVDNRPALRFAGRVRHVPLIVDTDIFSDADDVTALAVAFGLQLKGEAKVIAINVNTRTDRPSVATNSWKCAAAVAQFYGSGNIPIGSDTPSNGTSVSDPDFIGPCAALASASTPTPDTAVNVYRRALATQPDGSVVIVGIGYCENLSALLNSPADSISPLTGRDLVAKKVKTLVIMAGGYPSRSGENRRWIQVTMRQLWSCFTLPSCPLTMLMTFCVVQQVP